MRTDGCWPFVLFFFDGEGGRVLPAYFERPRPASGIHLGYTNCKHCLRLSVLGYVPQRAPDHGRDVQTYLHESLLPLRTLQE